MKLPRRLLHCFLAMVPALVTGIESATAVTFTTWMRQINRETVGGTNRGGTVWILGDNIEGKDFYRGNYRQMDSFSTLAGGRTEVLGGALDALRYYGGSRQVQPVFGALTLPGDPAPSKISVVGASLAIPAVDWKDPSKPVLVNGIPVFGSWDVLVMDEASPHYSVLLRDSYGVRVPVNAGQERMFIPLYVSP